MYEETLKNWPLTEASDDWWQWCLIGVLHPLRRLWQRLSSSFSFSSFWTILIKKQERAERSEEHFEKSLRSGKQGWRTIASLKTKPGSAGFLFLIFLFAPIRPKTPLKDLLPPKKPNFHILENLRRPILLCAPKKVGNHFHFLTDPPMTTNCTLGVFKVGSMTFFWAVLSHLDEEDGAVWIHGPNRSTRYKNGKRK